MAPRWNTEPTFCIGLILFLLAVSSLCLACLWISRLHAALQAFLGIIVGVALMISCFIMQMERSHYRRNKGVAVAQLSSADMSSLRKLLSMGTAPSWLPDSPGTEQVRWLNVGLCEVWPFFKEAYSGMLELQLQALFNQYKYGAIKELSIGKLNLGKCYPFIQGIKPSDNVDGETSLEVQVDWRQNEEQEMILHAFTSGPEYVVQVRHFVIYAELKLTFKPMNDELPGFSAVVISIIEPPLVDFQTKILKGDVKVFPEMEKAVDRILLAALMDRLVWPNRAVFPFVPGDYSYLMATSSGHLHVRLIEAKELANKELTGRLDPYVVLFVRWRQDHMKESSTMHDTSEPEWNENFVFKIEDPAAQKLTIKMMNAADNNLNDYVGTWELAIKELEENIREDIWVELVGDPARLQGRCAGRVHLLLEYKPLHSDCRECDHTNSVSKANDMPMVELRECHVQTPGELSTMNAAALKDTSTEGDQTLCGKSGVSGAAAMVGNNITEVLEGGVDVGNISLQPHLPEIENQFSIVNYAQKPLDSSAYRDVFLPSRTIDEKREDEGVCSGRNGSGSKETVTCGSDAKNILAEERDSAQVSGVDEALDRERLDIGIGNSRDTHRDYAPASEPKPEEGRALDLAGDPVSSTSNAQTLTTSCLSDGSDGNSRVPFCFTQDMFESEIFEVD